MVVYVNVFDERNINQSLLDKLQAVLRAAARLVMKKLKFDHISDDIRDELHWLPVKQRISFKICMYVRRCLDHEAPAYLSDMLTSVSDVDAMRRHRFADRADLVVPRTKIVSSVATIFGAPRKQLVWVHGQGVTTTTSSRRAPGGPLQPRGPPRGRGVCGALATPLKIVRYGDRSFAVSGPRLWNALPAELKLRILVCWILNAV